jgi:hypothetical protein
MARKKVPMGKAIKVDAAITDQATIMAQWRKDAPPALRLLLDAKSQPK